MKKIFLKFFFIGYCFLWVNPVSGQIFHEKEKPKINTRILFLFDASASMYGRWQSDMKIISAQKLLCELLDSISNIPDLQLGLRVFGHQKPVPPQDCKDTKLEIPLAAGNAEQIKHKLRTIVPKGTTSIGYSLEQAAKDFPPCGNCRNIIVLITDGIEECDRDPCLVSIELQKSGVILKPFIIGIGKNFKEQFDCMGTYFDATEEIAFKNALNIMISYALNPTTMQVNLLDEKGKPTETNVNMTFYDAYSGAIKYNLMHTLNTRGLPDTLVVDHLNTYNLKVHTIPPVKYDSLRLSPGKHSVIGLDAPQGFLQLKTSGRPSMYKNILCIVKKSGQMETLNLQSFEQVEKYIKGKYDLEILTLPRIYLNDIIIKQSHTTDVTIPSPGMAFIQMGAPGFGSLYVMEKNQLKWIYNISTSLEQESVYLQPGKYKIVFRSKFANRAYYTVEKFFDIESGTTTRVKIYE